MLTLIKKELNLLTLQVIFSRTTLQVVIILVVMVTRILELATNLNWKSPVRLLKST